MLTTLILKSHTINLEGEHTVLEKGFNINIANIVQKICLTFKYFTSF